MSVNMFLNSVKAPIAILGEETLPTGKLRLLMNKKHWKHMEKQTGIKYLMNYVRATDRERKFCQHVV